MKPPPRPDEGGGGGGITWDTKARLGRHLVTPPAPSPQASKQQLLRQLEAARQQLDRRTEALEIIAAWRDELRVRLARAELRAELIGLHGEEQHALAVEVNAFRRCCRGSVWPTRGRHEH